MKRFFADLGKGVKSVFKGPASKDNLFALDNRVPIGNAIPFGLQHILAMFVANITPIIIVFAAIGLLDSELGVQALLGAVFMAGVGAIAQLLIGVRLPVVLGTSFTFVPVLLTIGTSTAAASDPVTAYYTIMGSLIFGALFAIVFSLFYKWWGKLIKPIVPAIVVLGVGLSLLTSGANSFLGGTTIINNIIMNGETGAPVPYFCYIIVAFATLITSLLWSVFMTGVWKNLSVVAGIVVGYILSCCFPGMIDFSGLAITEFVGSHGVIDYPHLINLTRIRFELVPCILTSVCFIATIIEAIGNTDTTAKIAMGRKSTSREINGGLIIYGANSAIAALFGAFPLTIYAQNVGIVSQTKVTNRFTIFLGAAFLVIASFFPPIANFLFTIPDVVIGGSMVILFGSIAIIGMKSISEIGWSDKNITITALSICLGFGMTIATVTVGGGTAMSLDLFNKLGVGWLGDMLSNNVLNMFVIAFILSWVLPEDMHISLFHKKEQQESK